MTLVPVDNEPGLWRSPDWKRNSAGVYALIVGASEYRFFRGGRQAVADSHGLEQLVSSAATAAELFEWLRDSFRCTGLEVVWCKLLLAPTEAEREKLKCREFTHYDNADYETFRTAIQTWSRQLPNDKLPAQASRSLFFFSGHGVQANNDPLLLPSDYLDPGEGEPLLQNCISTRELRWWMDECPLGEHVALIDACRNEFSPLATRAATAYTVFPDNTKGGAGPRGWAYLASTSPNMVSYQLPNKPRSIFGQAVIDGLRGRQQPAGPLSFRTFVDFVRPRVNELLKQATKAPVVQPVWPSTNGQEPILTELTESGDGLEQFGFSSLGLDDGDVKSAPALADVEAALDAQFTTDTVVAAPLQKLRSGSEAHDRFGHEYASLMWARGDVKLVALGDGQAIPLDNDMILTRVARDAKSSSVRVDVTLPRFDDGVALIFEGGDVQRERLLLTLPTDMVIRVPVRLTLAFAPPPGGPRPLLQAVSAGFGSVLFADPDYPAPQQAVEAYEYLWSIHRQAELGSLLKAARAIEPQRLEVAVANKLLNPTAAMAAALLLAEAGEIARLDVWTRNLQRYFPNVPDGAVLWCESLRQAHLEGKKAHYGVSDVVTEAARSLVQLKTRGVPFLVGAVELAERQVRWLLRDGPSELCGDLEEVRAMLEVASGISVPGGHFMAYSSTPRPQKLAGGGALDTDEILRVIRPTRA